MEEIATGTGIAKAATKVRAAGERCGSGASGAHTRDPRSRHAPKHRNYQGRRYHGIMTAAAHVSSLLRADPLRWRLLGIVQALHLPDCWIGAGFVRNAVWDHLHGQPAAALDGDVDVIWYDPLCTDAAEDREIEARLRRLEPDVAWSVKNQARMHVRNGDLPYASATDAMRFWPETATAVAARRSGSDDCDVAAPLGLDDLLGLVLRPTARFTTDKRIIYEQRVRSKNWLECWPLLSRAESQNR